MDFPCNVCYTAGMKMKLLKSILLIVLGLLSLVYYGTCIAWAHIGVSWLWIWPLLSLFCFGRAAMLLIEYRQKRHLMPKGVRIAWYTLVCIGLCIFAAIEGSILSAMRMPAKDGLDYIIVLGAAVRGETPTSPLLLRMERALDYLEQNPNTVAIASGGQGRNESISEAECIRRYLIAHGIEETRILLEDQSHDTAENIRNSLALIGRENAANIGIVTSSFHLRRALLIAEQNGLQASGVPARALLPLGIHYTVREFFGIVELMIRGA